MSVLGRQAFGPAVAAVVDNCYATIDNDPRVLLEAAGGPVGRTAHVIVARLYGWDEEEVAEWRLRRVEPVLLVPILRRPRYVAVIDATTTIDADLPRAATYRLQSSWAEVSIHASDAPREPHGDDFLVRVLCVRYKRDPMR